MMMMVMMVMMVMMAMSTMVVRIAVRPGDPTSAARKSENSLGGHRRHQHRLQT